MKEIRALDSEIIAALGESTSKMVSYFTGGMQRVKVAGIRSDVLSKGTPGRSILGPFKFNMCINAFVLKLQSVFVVFFFL